MSLGQSGQKNRMRYVELRRHTDNRDDALSPQGVADAERLPVHPPYVVFVSTGAARATEMAEILRRSAGQEDVAVDVVPGLRSSVEDRWREAARMAGKGADLEKMSRVDPDLVELESRLLGAALREVFDGLPDEGRALVVGHSPTNEAAVMGLTGQLVGPLGKGDGVLVVEDARRYRAEPLQ